MLQAILAAFRQANVPLTAQGLSRQLGIEPETLAGMLQTLVRKGYLVEVGENAPCPTCPLKALCVPDPSVSPRYRLAGETCDTAPCLPPAP